MYSSQYCSCVHICLCELVPDAEHVFTHYSGQMSNTLLHESFLFLTFSHPLSRFTGTGFPGAYVNTIFTVHLTSLPHEIIDLHA